ncbi:hypothetical protein OG539_40655 [Actinacidiphila glaucinigra]|uniref:hypothetical protein n=1 Tax=Actinacidiphila glaucinigra TaxID=235986 RepID=UPI002DDBC4A8|nr:hypothetical protein [Actinacidiphila glaucinigra]WSD57911.1 hypothetical protein OIE69_02835 [Actinacidiphila glaucinigra]
MRRRIAACVAVLAVASAGACTESAAHTEGKAATSAPARTIGPSACGNGTYQWFNVERPIRLSALSDVQTLGKGGGKFTKAPKHRVSWPETSVSAHGPAVPRRDVLFSLAKLVGEAQEDDTGADMAFTDVGRKPGDPNRSRAISTTGAGRYVMYDEAHIVEADFRYTCPHSMAVTIGHAKSWTMEGSGILECGTPIDFGSQAHQAVARVAARISCGPKSRAAQAKAVPRSD